MWDCQDIRCVYTGTPLGTSPQMMSAYPAHFASFQKLSGSTVWEVLEGMTG